MRAPTLRAIFLLLSSLTVSSGLSSQALGSATGVEADLFSRLEKTAGDVATQGNRVRLRVNGTEFWPIRLQKLQEAQRTIDVHTYLWCDDEVGTKAAEEFIAAKNRGVRVRIILDWLNLMAHKKVYKMVRAAGIPILEYNPSYWAQNINKRLHEKVQIIDGRHMLIGGANLCNEYMTGQPHPTKPVEQLWHDLELEAEGPVAARAQARFDETWNWMATQDMNIRAERFARGYPVLPARFYETSGPTSADVSPQGEAMAIYAHQQPYWHEGQNLEFVKTYSAMVRDARHDLVLYIPYFLPNPDFEQAILETARRGVHVTIMTNSDKTNDMAEFLQAGGVGHYGRMLEAGVRFFEVTERTLHAKAILVDDRVLTVGSHNFTHRSFGLNGEANLITDSPEAIARFQEMWADDQKTFHFVTEKEYKSRTVGTKKGILLIIGAWIRKLF